MNLAFDHRQEAPGQRAAWHGVERRQARQAQGRVIDERALLALVIVILALAAWRSAPAQGPGAPVAGGAPASRLAAQAPRIGVIGASEADLRAVVGLLDPAGSDLVTVVNTTASGGPAQAVSDSAALRAMLADTGVCVALALAPSGDLAEARRLANAAAGAEKPVVFVFTGIDPRMRLLNRGNSRLSTASTPAEGAARALGLARLRGCAPRVQAAPLPPRA